MAKAKKKYLVILQLESNIPEEDLQSAYWWEKHMDFFVDVDPPRELDIKKAILTGG